MPESTPADSNASKDTQSTLFPPDSRVSGDSSDDAKHMCYCAMHLQPGESDQPSWTGGKPIINNDIDSARIHFSGDSDREPTIFEAPSEDEGLVGSVTKSKLDQMGLWPSYREGFKTATGMEFGLIIDGEFENMLVGDPTMDINRSVMKDGSTFDHAYYDFFSSNTVKKEFDYIYK
ncbi:hypothetical protein B9479_006244 [Cryptococcus floricola]|uniref:Uncharacterized protein n=1 Tax=Cryptococcus floricola TaxID=2591691 RepID=A0A5D3AQS7_9TREE|nr:hypothetical protein B9479_006244 [Cryptococcus floricola]